MPVPSVRAHMPLCVTPRSKVCDEQGVGQWPMWKRYDSIRSIVDQYIDEQYRSFFSMPYHEVDKLKAEELFYWYAPRSETSYVRLSCTGDDYDHYKEIFDETLAHYKSTVVRLREHGKIEESTFLQLSLKYVGESDDNIYCGDDRVVVTVWGMRTRQNQSVGESKLFTELIPEVETHTVRFELGNRGTTNSKTELKKSHGSKIQASQIPTVNPKEGYEFDGWDTNPLNIVVKANLVFAAQYKDVQTSNADVGGTGTVANDVDKGKETPVIKHHVRFLSCNNRVIKELEVEHNRKISPVDIPQLPAEGGIICPSWDGNPLNDIIVADHDYKALPPNETPKQTHTVRFLTPDRKVITTSQVEHGVAISPAIVPPLPVVDGKLSLGWNDDPIGTIVNADIDFVAKWPTKEIDVTGEDDVHKVRFLDDDGNEISQILVPHGTYLQNEQIPQLSMYGSSKPQKWDPDPSKQLINRDTDFRLRKVRAGHLFGFGGGGSRRGFWRWLFFIILFLLIVFLVLYIMYRCNPCSK